MGNRNTRSGLIALGTLGLAALSCGGAPRTNYYALRFDPAPLASSPPAATRVGVELPHAAHLLRQDRIVYFTDQNELNFYHYHRWAEPPPFLVQSLLIRQLRRARLFDDIVAYRAQKDLDYILRGRLLAMEEVDTATDISARFSLELELLRQQDSHVVWTGGHSCQRPVATKTVDAVVETLSGCVEETLFALTGALAEAVGQLEQVSTDRGRKQP